MSNYVTSTVKTMTADIERCSMKGTTAHFCTVSGADFTQHPFSHEQLNE